MDKIDLVIFRYKRERKISKEFKNFIWIMTIPMVILLILYLLAIILSPKRWGCIMLLVCAFGFMIWTKFFEAKWGSQEWKYKLQKLYRGRFLNDQKQLIEIIGEGEMNCQQVYNLLIKKYNRMPQSSDKTNYIIPILSLVVALTGILISPLKEIGIDEYISFVVVVVYIITILGVIGGILYKVITAQNEQRDEKKSYYEYVLELLEDYLY